MSYTPYTRYNVKIVVIGDNIEVYMGDMNTPILTAIDSNLSQGNIAFYTWANVGGAFGSFTVNGLSETGKHLLS